MAQVPIELLDLRRASNGLLEKAVKLANGVQAEYVFSIMDDDRSYDLAFSVHDDTDINEFMAQLSRRKQEWRGFHPFLLCLFDTAINNEGFYNLFSVDVAGVGFAAVTVHNVDTVLIPSERMNAYVLFQMAFFALKFSGCNIRFHEEDRACIFDYRENKEGIVEAIRKPHICDQCRKELDKTGSAVSASQLRSVFSLLRLASQQLVEPQGADSARPAQRVFIGSSREGLSVAQAIQRELELERDIQVEIWTQSDTFGLGSSTLEALEAAVDKYDFSIFVFTADDQIEKRQTRGPVPRDNVVFEAGLFIGKLGRRRTFIVRPRDVDMQIPSDLNGITVADYDSAKTNLTAAVGPACSRIRESIRSFGT